MLAVPEGMPAQASGGGVLPPRQENLAGIAALSANARLRTVIAAGLADVAVGVTRAAGVLAVGPEVLGPAGPLLPEPQAASRRTSAADRR